MFGAAVQLTIISMSGIGNFTIVWTIIIFFNIFIQQQIQGMVIIEAWSWPWLSFGPSAKTKAKATAAAYHSGNNLTQHEKLEPWSSYFNYEQLNKYIPTPVKRHTLKLKNHKYRNPLPRKASPN